MKRLKYYLLQMDNSTSTYKEMYEGDVIVPAETPGNPSAFPEHFSDNMFWYGDYSFSIELSNKLSLDKPTILCQIPAEIMGIDVYNTATADFCYRQLIPYFDSLNEMLFNRHKTEKETGHYYCAQLSGEILVRNSSYFSLRPRKDYVNRDGNKIEHYSDEKREEPQMCLCMRIQVQLPQKKIKKAISMLTNDLPKAIEEYVSKFDRDMLQRVIDLSKKQNELRIWLKNSDYCAFIANGSILPRDSKTGHALHNAIPFSAPMEDEIEVLGIKGFGIKKGVTVIAGGGYSGKSTVLDAISAGIYDHVLGDGRELCITDDTAMAVSAEDGRCIKNIDISPFISWLPGGNTKDFSTEHASGSTSQAANVLEAIDAGSQLLLIDEDKSATNFMIRDQLMKELIKREPITPFTERVNELYESCKVSTILVIGGSGEYLSVADHVYLMDEYRIYNVTERTKNMVANRVIEAGKVSDWCQKRQLKAEGFSAYPERFNQERLSVPDIGYIYIGDEKVDTKGIHNLVCNEQRTALAFMLRIIENRQNEEYVNLPQAMNELYCEIEEKGLDTIYSGFFPECERFLAYPRKFELHALVNRMRKVQYSISGEIAISGQKATLYRQSEM